VVALKGSYVDLIGFDISGLGDLGIYNTGSYNRIMGNHVHNIPAAGCPAYGGAGIHDGNYSASNNDIIGNFVHDIGDYTQPCNRVHGIYHAQYGGHIYNNVSVHNQGWGIHLYHAATNVTISNNTVVNNAYGGIIVSASSGDFPSGSGTVTNTYVVNNLVYNNGHASGASGYGIEEYGSSVGTNYYNNNNVYQNGPSDWNLSSKAVRSGNISASPQLVNNTGDANGNYALTSSDPGINHGVSSPAPANDYKGGARPVGGAWDIGAYEYGATGATYSWF
jgi:hypothetical protein